MHGEMTCETQSRQLEDIVSTLVALGVFCSVLFAGCAAEENGMISSTQGTQQDVITSGPAITSAGTSTARILPPSPVGPGLRINGGSELGSFLIASYDATTGSSGATAGVTLTPAPGAAFVYMLRGSGLRPSTRQLRIQRQPGSTTLEAMAATGATPCGTLASGRPTHVTLVFHAASMTFDVFIGGAASRCTGLPANLQPPVVGFAMMDASNEGWGGRVDYTDLTIF